jgi:hypothetical protein
VRRRAIASFVNVSTVAIATRKDAEDPPVSLAPPCGAEATTATPFLAFFPPSKLAAGLLGDTYFLALDLPPGEGTFANLLPGGRPPPAPCPGRFLDGGASVTGVDVSEEEVELLELELVDFLFKVLGLWCAGAASCAALA